MKFCCKSYFDISYLTVLTVVYTSISVSGLAQSNNDESDQSILEKCPGINENPNLIVLSDKAKQNGETHEFLKMQCSASYPVKWTYQGNKPNDIYFNQKIITNDTYDATTTKVCYVSLMSSFKWGSVLVGRSGNYTCSSMSDPEKKTSVYKFIDGEGSKSELAIFNSPKNVKVMVPKRDDDWLVIPCASNVPDVNATLWSESENGTINSLPTSITTHYDPKIGFRLQKWQSDTNTTLVGHYLCHAVTSKRISDTVQVEVLKAPEYVATPDEETITPKNGQVFVGCEANELVNIKIINIQGGRSHNNITTSGLNTDRNYNYSSTLNVYAVNEEGNISYTVSGEAACQTDTNRTLHTWKFDTEHSCHCSWEFVNKLEESDDDYEMDEDETEADFDIFNLSDIIEDYTEKLSNSMKDLPAVSHVDDTNHFAPKELKGRLVCSNPSYSPVSFALLHCGNANECEVKSSCLSLKNCPFADKSKVLKETRNSLLKNVSYVDVTLQSGIIKCNVAGYISTQTVVASLDNMYFNKVPDNATVINIVAPETRFVTGDKLLFSCEVEKYQLADDLVWAYQFKNKSIKVINDIDSRENKMGRHKYKIYRTSYVKLPSSDITALICFAPLWPSREYKNFTLPLRNQDIGVPIASDDRCDNSVETPQIIVHRVSTHNPNRTRGLTISNGRTITIENPVNQFKLVCRAPYPTKWMKDDEAINATRTQWSNCSSSSDVSKKTGRWYDSILEFPLLNPKNTGNYTCLKVSNLGLKSFVYVFASGNGSNKVLEAGRHMTVVKPLDDPDPWAIFPCRTTNPFSVPTFLVDHGDEPMEIMLSNNLRYDPTRGFLLNIQTISFSTSTYFYCSLAPQSDTFDVLFTLIRPEGPNVIEGYHTSQPDSNSSATFIASIVFLVVIVGILSLALLYLFKRHKQMMERSNIIDTHQMSNTSTVAMENPVFNNDSETSVSDGSYLRFS